MGVFGLFRNECTSRGVHCFFTGYGEILCVYVSDQEVLKASYDSAGLELELETLPLQQAPGSAHAIGLWTTL